MACNAAPSPEPAATEGVGAGEATTTTETGSATAVSESSPTVPSSEGAQVAGGRLQAVQDRGELICGVHGSLPGFGIVDASGEYAGFDVDFCRAIAAAVLGDPEAVEFRPLTAQERFTAVQTGEVDVLSRNTTYTISRDTSVGLDFGPVTFYDGQGMMVRKDSGIESLEDMAGATICVQSGTTTELNLADSFRARSIEFTPVVFSDADPTREAYNSGQCDGFTTDRSGLVASQTQLTAPEDHKILPDTLSKEPLGPSVLQGDAQWADVITWVVYATIQAEEFGIDQSNLEEMLASEDPNIRRFLGAEGELGQGMGLSNDFVVQIIRGVGNYGEIYNRNLGPDTPFDLPRGQNSLFTEGGLLYSPPFR
ncbi:MAG: amino acid ABC transporter substrate-binding protein [Ardenticatenales bacterium]|nr:amino acid ABC transporter substrate-binding protein [Ardenticatenales bacterium]